MFPPDYSEYRPNIPSDLKHYSQVIQLLTGHSTIIDYIQDLERNSFEPEILQIGIHEGKNIDYLLQETSRCHVISIHPDSGSNNRLKKRIEGKTASVPYRQIRVHHNPIDDFLQKDEHIGKYTVLIINNGRLHAPLSLPQILQIGTSLLHQSGLLLASGIHSDECDSLPETVVRIHDPWQGMYTIGGFFNDLSL